MKNIVRSEGDIINVDVSTILDGYFFMHPVAFMIGGISGLRQTSGVTEECVELALQLQNHRHLGDIGMARSIPMHRQRLLLLLLISAVTESD